MAHSHTRLIPELTIEEMALRSLLMRLYHSRLVGDVYYPKAFVNGHAPALIEAGWIEVVGEGFRLTEVGVRGWAEMLKPLICSQRYPGINELKAETGLPLDGVRRLSKQHKAYLRELIEAGGRLPGETFDPRTMNHLRTHGFVIAIGETWIEITAAGREAVGEPHPYIRGDTPPPFLRGDGSPPLSHPPHSDREGNKAKVKYCVVPGCKETRMVSKNGKTLTMCPQHQRAYWRQLKK